MLPGRCFYLDRFLKTFRPKHILFARKFDTARGHLLSRCLPGADTVLPLTNPLVMGPAQPSRKYFLVPIRAAGYPYDIIAKASQFKGRRHVSLGSRLRSMSASSIVFVIQKFTLSGRLLSPLAKIIILQQRSSNAAAPATQQESFKGATTFTSNFDRSLCK